MRLNAPEDFMNSANSVHSSPMFMRLSRCSIMGAIHHASVSTKASFRSGNRSNTPPSIICHSERPEKKECSVASTMIAAKPAGW